MKDFKEDLNTLTTPITTSSLEPQIAVLLESMMRSFNNYFQVVFNLYTTTQLSYNAPKTYQKFVHFFSFDNILYKMHFSSIQIVNTDIYPIFYFLMIVG